MAPLDVVAAAAPRRNSIGNCRSIMSGVSSSSPNDSTSTAPLTTGQNVKGSDDSSGLSQVLSHGHLPELPTRSKGGGEGQVLQTARGLGRPTISLITGAASPVDHKLNIGGVSGNNSTLPILPALTNGNDNHSASSASDTSERQTPIAHLQNSPVAGHSTNLPSFHHHSHPGFPPRPNHPSQLSAPLPSPDLLSARRDEYLHRPFASYSQHAANQQSPPPPFSDNSELDDDARSRKRYGRPPGAKDKRPRRRRTKAQMEEDALIYGYRDADAIYHSPTSLSKRRRLSPRRDSIENSPREGTASPPPSQTYSFSAYPNFPQPQPSNSSPSDNFNPYLHRHHLPLVQPANPLSTSSQASSFFRSHETPSNGRVKSETTWPSRTAEIEIERPQIGQIPNPRPRASDHGVARYPTSPIGPTAFPFGNLKSAESFKPQSLFSDRGIDKRALDPTNRFSVPFEGSKDALVSTSAGVLPRVGDLPRLSELPLDRARWESLEDSNRKLSSNFSGSGEKRAYRTPFSAAGPISDLKIPTEASSLTGKYGSSTSNWPPPLDALNIGAESTETNAYPQDRATTRCRSNSITNLGAGPPLEADTTKRDEEDTDEQIDEYRTRMLEQHSSYYNGSSGKPRVKREPSYAIPKVPLQEENERLRAALQRYRQQRGIERLKLIDFVQKRLNGDPAMRNELLTIAGHSLEDDYIGPVKPACL